MGWYYVQHKLFLKSQLHESDLSLILQLYIACEVSHESWTISPTSYLFISRAVHRFIEFMHSRQNSFSITMEPATVTRRTLTFNYFAFSMEPSDPHDETATLALPFAKAVMTAVVSANVGT